MKHKKLVMLAALLCTTASWAEDFSVASDSELRSAIQNDEANITVTADIDLGNSTLSIESGLTVTINLGGHTLDRKLTKRGEDGGQVFTVRNGATLNLSNGTITGGWGGDSGGINNEGGTANLTNVIITGCTGDDRGGGICNRSGGTLTMTGGAIMNNISYDHTAPEGGGGLFNAEGATMTLKGVTITGNKAKVKGGGGICNYGTLTLDGCTITGNSCQMNGGGIWTAATATLNMQGVTTVADNTTANSMTNNLFLKTDAVITVTGVLTGSNISITMENNTGTFTSGYNTNNAGIDPGTLFKADLSEVMNITIDADDEAQLANSLPEGSVYYIERSWNDGDKCVKTQVKTLSSDSYTTLTGGDDIELQPGFYVVKNNIEHDDIVLAGSGEHHLILCDGATVEADILNVPEGQTVYIYGQEFNTGKLYIPFGDDDTEEHEAPIGGRDGKSCGTIIIHGGDIYAEGRDSSAGIGGGSGAGGGTVIIYGGNIKVEGGNSGAGIGTGSNYNPEHGTGPFLTSDYPSITGGSVTIYGGYIEAYGGDHGAGIGGGHNAGGAHVAIHGGIVKAWGATNGAGIGTGVREDDALQYTGELTVTGGEVYAYGSDDHDGLGDGGGGAGIGGGRNADGSTVTISGGYVYAKGGAFGAGIGSGCEALFSGGKQGGSLTVTGGQVEAYGGEDAAGIGGGEDADGGTVNISGGEVYAKGSYGGAGIGGGEGGDGAHVTITGGTVHASAGSGDTGNRAIGPGYGCDAYGSLTIGDVLMVRAERLASAGERHDMCWYRTDVHVEPCDHQDHTYTISGTTANDTHTEVCTYCTTPFEPEKHTFVDGKCTVCGTTIDNTAGIISVESSPLAVGRWYTLDGRKLQGKPTQKGVYINNGKKVVIE